MGETLETIVKTTPETETPEVEMMYIFAVHGFPPELMSHVAFRRAKGFNIRMKEIKCPYCKQLFTKVEESTKIKVYQRPRSKEVFCHETKACHICNGIVGIYFCSHK